MLVGGGDDCSIWDATEDQDEPMRPKILDADWGWRKGNPGEGAAL